MVIELDALEETTGLAALAEDEASDARDVSLATRPERATGVDGVEGTNVSSARARAGVQAERGG